MVKALHKSPSGRWLDCGCHPNSAGEHHFDEDLFCSWCRESWQKHQRTGFQCIGESDKTWQQKKSELARRV